MENYTTKDKLESLKIQSDSAISSPDEEEKQNKLKEYEKETEKMIISNDAYAIINALRELRK